MTKLPISDKELEFTVLKCFLMEKGLQHNLFKLNEDDFYSIGTKELFTYMLSVVSEKEELDFSLLPRKYKIEPFYLPLMNQIPLVALFSEYFHRLKDISNRRKLQKMAQEINIKVEEGKKSDEIRSAVSDVLNGLYSPSIKSDDQNKEVDLEFKQRMMDKSIPFIETGFADIDDCIGGFMPSTFTVIAGAPTIGKTTLVLNMVNHACRNLKKNVMFVSLEMSYIQLQAKLISNLVTIDSRKLINPRRTLNSSDIDKVNVGRDILRGYKLYRLGDKDITTGSIEDELRRLGNIDILFVDYLQLLKPRFYINQRYDRVTQVSNELKRISRKFNIPVVCIASINRASANRETKRPRLSDLRDSGNIEYDVDTALLLHRESEVREYNPRKDENEQNFLHEAEVHIAKNRFGEADMLIKLWWEPEYSRFRNMARPEIEPVQSNMNL
jgi:replicative DNA helicase